MKLPTWIYILLLAYWRNIDVNKLLLLSHCSTSDHATSNMEPPKEKKKVTFAKTKVKSKDQENDFVPIPKTNSCKKNLIFHEIFFTKFFLQFGLEPPERGYFCPFSRYPVSTNPIPFPKTTPFWAKVVSASFMASTNLPNPAKNVLLLEMWMGIWRSKNWGNPWLWVNKRSFKSSKKYEFILSALGFLTFCPFWRPGKMSGTCTWLCLFVIVDRWPIYSRREKRHFLVSRFWLRQIKSTQVNHSFIARKLKLCMWQNEMFLANFLLV